MKRLRKVLPFEAVIAPNTIPASRLVCDRPFFMTQERCRVAVPSAPLCPSTLEVDRKACPHHWALCVSVRVSLESAKVVVPHKEAPSPQAK
jgi:hypothetical protein